MRQVHIYAEAQSTAPRCAARQAGYVLEYKANGRTYTREDFYEDTGTYNAVILRALAKGARRIKEDCELHVHTQNRFVLDMLDDKLPFWAANGYVNAKGELVKNYLEWQDLYELTKGHLITRETGMHAYYYWMMGEMQKRRKSP